jgi:neurofibromin 1
MATLLLQGRTPLDEAALPLEEIYGIHFDQESFHLAVCACLARGLTDTMTRQITMRVLSAFLDMTSNAEDGKNSDIAETSPYLSLLIARAVEHDELKDSLWSAGFRLDDFGLTNGMRKIPDNETMADNTILLITAIELVDFQYVEDSVQTRSLDWLNELAKQRPDVVGQL